MVDILITIVGLAIPISFLLFAWHLGTPMGFSTATLVFGVLAGLGMGQIIPLFGTEVVGGSTYFPAVFLCIAMCAKRYGTEITLQMLNCVSRGMLLFSLAQFRWLFFAVYAPEHTTYDLATASVLGRNALLMTGMVYFGGLLILTMRKKLEDSSVHYRFAVPVIVDILLMSPISIWAAYTSFAPVPSGADTDWLTITVFTLLSRLVVPVIVITYIVWRHDWDAHKAEEHLLQKEAR